MRALHSWAEAFGESPGMLSTSANTIAVMATLCGGAPLPEAWRGACVSRRRAKGRRVDGRTFPGCKKGKATRKTRRHVELRHWDRKPLLWVLGQESGIAHTLRVRQECARAPREISPWRQALTCRSAKSFRPLVESSVEDARVAHTERRQHGRARKRDRYTKKKQSASPQDQPLGSCLHFLARILDDVVNGFTLIWGGFPKPAWTLAAPLIVGLTSKLAAPILYHIPSHSAKSTSSFHGVFSPGWRV
jgi:hypothetical protein